MSAYHPIATIERKCRDVGLVLIAEVAAARNVPVPSTITR